jgi:hypothetical protein
MSSATTHYHCGLRKGQTRLQSNQLGSPSIGSIGGAPSRAAHGRGASGANEAGNGFQFYHKLACELAKRQCLSSTADRAPQQAAQPLPIMSEVTEHWVLRSPLNVEKERTRQWPE